MRKPYLARLADLQATLNQPESHSSPGELIRSFLIHEYITTKNPKKSKLLTTNLAIIISALETRFLTGSHPFSSHFVLSTIFSFTDHIFTVTINNPRGRAAGYEENMTLA